MIQYENYLAQALSTEVAAKGAYVKAKIALQRAIGTILDENHVAIDEAYRGDVARPADSLPKAGSGSSLQKVVCLCRQR